MLANILIILAVIFWGLSFVAGKKVLQFLSPTELMTIRLLLGIPVLAIIMKIKGLSFKFIRKDYAILIIASLILGAHWIIQTIGLHLTTATNTAWLIATIPAFVAVLSWLFLKEKLTSLKIFGIFLGTVGVILLVSRGDLKSLDWLSSIGDWLVLITCITWSVYTIITRDMTRQYHPLSIILTLMLIPTISLIASTLILSPLSRFFALPVEIYLYLIFLSVFCLGLAHWFWLEGLSRKGATEAGAFLYLEPIVTTLAAAPILGEKITLAVIISAVLIITGVSLTSRRQKENQP